MVMLSISPMAAFARPLILANLAAIWIYVVLWQGAQRFYVESFGTWVISPLIYARICPVPWKDGMVRALNSQPVLGYLMCAVPIAMALVACGLGVLAFRRRSFPVALVACLLMSSIFVVYHSVKHMGMTLEWY